MHQSWLSGLSVLSFTIGLISTRSTFKARLRRPCKTTSVSTHTDVQWCSTWSQAWPDRCKWLTHECTHGQRANASAKARGSRSTYLSTSITFNTRITTYKKQWPPDWCSIQLLLLLAHALLHTKNKGLPIDATYNFYYFSYMPSVVHKKQGAP
jgi:hypothetical protein